MAPIVHHDLRIEYRQRQNNHEGEIQEHHFPDDHVLVEQQLLLVGLLLIGLDRLLIRLLLC